MGYITNFIVYTLAMVGVIVVALLVFKSATTAGSGKSSKYLKIIDNISIGQRKNLFIVSTGKEQFLIAGDVNNTCLISKIDNVGGIARNENVENVQPVISSFKETLDSLPKQNNTDKTNLFSNKPKGSVMRNLAEIMRKWTNDLRK